MLCVALSNPLGSTSCDRPDKPAVPQDVVLPKTDIPLLPVTPGDMWTYEVHLEIPEDVTSAGAAAVDERYQRVRTFLGKISPAEGLPAVDCFEVTAPVAPVEREFVDIYDDRILMRGSMIMRPDTTRPMWLDEPVPFVIAGIKAGAESPLIQAAGGSLSRKTQVIGREDVTVPAGTFPCIRLLMSGTDGELELRRTLWFSPGTGIVREEKTRYRLGNVIFRETHEFTKTSLRSKRRKDAAEAGLVHIPQFSPDLVTWTDSNATPTFVADGGEVEAVRISFPLFPSGPEARFFRMGLRSIR